MPKYNGSCAQEAVEGISNAERARLRTELTFLRHKMDFYIGHLMRLHQENGQRGRLLEALEQGHLVCVLDFKTKWLPVQARESHSEFFAQFGFPVHGIMSTRKMASGEYATHYFTQISNDVTEDAMWVVNALVQVIAEHFVGKVEPPITKISLFVDAAGCYSGALLTFLSSKLGQHLDHYFRNVKKMRPMPVIPVVTDIYVAEVGGGKSELDGFFAR